MSNRFEAEAIIRAAASGAIPAPGDVLLRTTNGWIFGKVVIGEIEGEISPEQISSLPFAKITGVLADGQVPVGVVKQHEGALEISFSQMTDEISDDQVPETAVLQYLDHVFERVGWIDFLLSRALAVRPQSPAEKLYMAENYL